MTSAFTKVPAISLPDKSLHQSISDIFSFMKLKCLAERITIGALIDNDKIAVRLQCTTPNSELYDNSELDMLASDEPPNERYRNSLKNIRIGLATQEIKSRLPKVDDNRFMIDLIIPIDRFLNSYLTDDSET
jgi:hypothetical protein